MNDIEVSSIDLVEGGNVFKQGHYLTLGYVPRDEKGDDVDLSGKTLNVALWGRKGVVFEAAATYSGGVIRFTFDKLVAAGDYTVEFTATSSTDAKYRKKFPTNQHSGRIAIKQSADDLGVVGIQVYTVAQLKAEQKALLDAAVSGFTVDSETKMARVSGTTTHPTIGARLEADKQVLTQQLADKLEQGGVSVLDIDKNKGLLDQSYMSSEFLQQIAGNTPVNATPAFNSLTRLHYTENSVTAKKVEFMNTSSNLYNFRNVVAGKGLNSTTGAIIDNATTSLGELIQVKPLTDYTINGSGVRRVGYDSAMNFVNTSTTAGTFQTPFNLVYLRLAIPNSQVKTVQLNEGAVLLPFEEYYEDLKDVRVSGDLLKVQSMENYAYKKNSITEDKLSFIRKSSNLYNKETRSMGKSIDQVTGQPIINMTTTLSDFISVTPLGRYIINGTGIRRAFYDKKMEFITSSTTAGAFTVPLNAAYMRMVVPNGQINTAQLNEGEILLPYESFYAVVEPKMIDKMLSYEFTPQEIIGDYSPISVKASDGSDPDGFNEDTDMAQDVYDRFDALMAKYPDYIKRERIGYDVAGVLPIYAYTFKPEESAHDIVHQYKPIPKVIVGAGIHGNGDDAGDRHTTVFALYHFMEDICENWTETDLLEYLRWDIHFEVVPIQNPWGFNNRQRRNQNGVDLNRNYDNFWFLSTPGSNTYGGTAPFSESESQAMRDFVLRHSDAVHLVDFHSRRNFPTDDALVYYDMARGNELFHVARYHIGKLSRSWRNYGLSNRKFYGYVLDRLAPSPKLNEWANNTAGVSAAIAEGFANSGTVNTLTTNGIEVMTMNTQMVGNWIVYALKHYKEKSA